MTKEPPNPAQEVQEYTPEQAAQIIKAAAEITGKPVTAFSVADAEAVLFGEIGYTSPSRPAEAARQEVLQYVAERMKQQQNSPENLSKLDLETIKKRLAIVKMRVTAVKALRDNGQGLEAELDAIAADLEKLKAEQAAESAALDEIELALSMAEEWACMMHERRTGRKLDLADMDAAKKEIVANPAILGFIPEDACISRVVDRLQALQGQINGIAQSVAGENLKATAKLVQSFGKVFEALREKAEQAEKVLTDFVKSEKFERLSLLFGDIAYWLDPESPGNDLDVFWLSDFIENIDTLQPYIETEIERLKAERGVDFISFEEFIRDIDPETGLSCESLFEICVKKAQEAIAAGGADKEEPAPQLPTTVIKRAEFLEYPLDKINGTIWRLLERDTGGQLAIKAEKTGSKEQVNIIYSIDFDSLGQGVTITKRLTTFDKRVYMAISALYNAGNNVITLSQIYYAMGYTGTPGKWDLTKINDAISKMAGAKVYVNNADETAHGYKYAKFIYDGALLPLERFAAVVNGKLADAAIHIFREPPVITFAKQREQITTIEVKLLQSPMSKTESNLQIDDYLIERICRAQRNKKTGSSKILYATLYSHAGITTKKQKQRAPEKIERYLEHYKKCGKITRYIMGDDGITVYW